MGQGKAGAEICWVYPYLNLSQTRMYHDKRMGTALVNEFSVVTEPSRYYVATADTQVKLCETERYAEVTTPCIG